VLVQQPRPLLANQVLLRSLVLLNLQLRVELAGALRLVLLATEAEQFFLLRIR